MKTEFEVVKDDGLSFRVRVPFKNRHGRHIVQVTIYKDLLLYVARLATRDPNGIYVDERYDNCITAKVVETRSIG